MEELRMSENIPCCFCKGIAVKVGFRTYYSAACKTWFDIDSRKEGDDEKRN